MIAQTIYLLCAVTSLVVVWLLWRQSRSRGSPLLFFGLIGFLGLAVNNVLVFVDLSLLPNVDLVLARTIAGTAGMVALLYGFIRSSGA